MSAAISHWPSSTARSTPPRPQDYDTVLRGAGRPIPALTVVSPRAYERLVPLAQEGSLNEYFTRPYSADSIRWRVEAMCIRRETVDDGSGPILQGGDARMAAGARRATTIAVFNPKGGVGKTTVATNLAAALQIRKGKSVLLIDADTVTGHVTMSLGIERGPHRRRQLARRGRRRPDRGPVDIAVGPPVRDEGRRADRLAAEHRRPRPGPGGRRDRRAPAAASTSSSSTSTRRTARSTRRSSTRPTGSSYRSPRTCRRSAPRSSSATSPSASAAASDWRWSSTAPTAASRVADMERTVGMPALALIRSGGLLFVRAANEGRTVIEMFPKEKITDGLRRPRRPRPRDAAWSPAAKAGFRRARQQAARPRLTHRPQRRRRSARRIVSEPGRSSWSRPSTRPGSVLVPLARPHVDLFDAAEVLAVDEDRRRRLRSDAVSPIVAVASTIGTNISDERSAGCPAPTPDAGRPCRRPGRAAPRGRPRTTPCGPDGRSARPRSSRGSESLPGEDDDEVVRVDGLEARAPAPAARNRRRAPTGRRRSRSARAC